MEFVLVRYTGANLKSWPVQKRMVNVVQQRVRDKLEYEDISYDKSSEINGRILVKTNKSEKAAEKISEIPGVSSVSPCFRCNSNIEEIKETAAKIDLGKTFGIDATRRGEHEFDSMDINRKIGSHLEEKNDVSVDLDNPDTWVYIEVRGDKTFVFDQKIEGSGGYPAAFEGNYATLVSGGYDSPVAAYEILKRGGDITPIYFYNKPIAAEDHKLRFEQTIKQLKSYHPGKKWSYYLFNMEHANKKLEEIKRGKMIVHRHLMYKLAEKVCEKENLNGIVTGEVLGQKSTQTTYNLEKSAEIIDKPVHRPLLTENKPQIVEKSKELGFFEISNINSACSSLSPDKPATKIKEEKLEELKKQVNFDELLEKCWDDCRKVNL